MELSNDSQLYESQVVTKNQQQKYKKIKVLGQGSMGKVYLVSCTQQQGKLYVMKRINIGHLQVKQKQQALQQAQLHNMVSHENIIAFKQIYQTTKDKLCIIMQYADGGDLDQFLKGLKQNKKMLNQQEIMKYFVQICLALKQIHDKKIVHRDLKGANIFLSKDAKIKLGDFGISKAMDKTVLASKSFVGTPFYLSPQMVQGKPYSTKADIWALGVILYHMCALKLPFDANSLPVLALKILKGAYPMIAGNQYSKDLKALISSMLLVDQKKRPSVNEILCKQIMSKYLPKQFVMTITPKIKAKVQLKVEKIKLATTKSKKQLSIQNQKMSEQEKRKKRQQQRIRRQQQRRRMVQDIKAKRGQPSKQTQWAQNQTQNKHQNIEINSATMMKKLPPKQQKPKSKVIIPTRQQLNIVQSVQGTTNQQKPWKNKNLLKQKKQVQIEIHLPVQRRASKAQVQEKMPLKKGQDFEVQIFSKGQNPYRNNKNINQTNNKNIAKSPFEKNYDNTQSRQKQIQQQIYRSSNGYEPRSNGYDSNLMDLLANVQHANNLVNKLQNPYKKNNIQLYEQSQDFDTTFNQSNQLSVEKDVSIRQSVNSKHKFKENERDNQNMKYITDGQNLEQLRQILEDRLGEDGFIKAHQIIKQQFQHQSSLCQQQNQQKQQEAYIFNRVQLKQKLKFLTEDQFQRNIQLLYTISIMEDMQMMKNFAQQQEAEVESFDQDES